MRLAYSYLRFSSAKQQWGHSKERQLEATHNFCARHKLTLDTTLTLHDFGVPAFRGQNLSEGALGVFLRAIAEGRVKKGSVLIVENFDRFSRAEPMEAFEVFSKIIRAGIAIATTSNDTIVDSKMLAENPYHLMIIIGELIRAHAESARKSYFGKRCWTTKRAKGEHEKLTARCPLWLRLSSDGKRFEEIPERTEVIRAIFRKIAEQGVTKVVKWLNRDKVPCFGNGRHWGRSSVMKIIHNRAVMGEYQPHELQFDGPRKKRVPVGKPIGGYYPTIIPEDQFYQVQKAIDSRKNQRGNIGKGVANLFTGLIVDARDGRKMNLVMKGTKKLVNCGAVHGAEGAVYKSFLYELFEKAVLRDLAEIKVRDLLPQPADKDVSERERLEAKLATVEAKIVRQKARILTEQDTEELEDVLLTLTKEKKELMALIEEAKKLESSAVEDDLQEAQSVLQLMEQDSTDEIRTRIKAKIRLLIDRIYVVVFDESVPDFGRKGRSKTFRFCDVQIVYKTGEVRRVICEEKTGFIFSGSSKVQKTHVDLRNYRNWYEKGNHQLAQVFKLCCMGMLMEYLGRKDQFMRIWRELRQIVLPADRN